MKNVDRDTILCILQEFIDKGDRCMSLCTGDDIDTEKCYNFWDGFHNCASVLYEEIKDLYSN